MTVHRQFAVFRAERLSIIRRSKIEDLFKIRIDVAHNYENPCGSIKVMLRNDIDALRRQDLENFISVFVLTKNRHFTEKTQIIKENEAFLPRRAF